MSRARRYGELLIVAVIASAVTSVIPALAHGIEHALFAHDSDKVDGKDAVAASASVNQRKGKIVATSPKTGRLPNSIIAKAPDANKLDGRDSSAFSTTSALSSPGTINDPANPVDWTRLKGVPSALADGTDDTGGNATDVSCTGCVNTQDIEDSAINTAKIGDGEVALTDLGFDPTTQAELDALQAQVDQLITRVQTLEDKLASVSYDSGSKILRIDGANLQITDGSGSTDGATNGRGNLIIGYNENVSDTRTGSHNLVVGPYHSYTSFGALISGFDNTSSATYASVTGGFGNTASGSYASATGGFNNTASGYNSSVTGGYNNAASGDNTSVTGGADNAASAQDSSVTGGISNSATETGASVTGGHNNTASGGYASITGGWGNTASGDSSSVIGGFANDVNADWASISGGFANFVSGVYASVTGGHNNTASGNSASVTGGELNVASGDYSSVSGGSERSATGIYDWVAGLLFEDE